MQIDSVNVLSRAHYLPLYSRLGPYPRTLLDRAAGNADAEGAHPRGPVRLFEYWAHEASLLPVRLHPLMRFRMARMAGDPWGGYARVEKERPGLVERVAVRVGQTVRPGDPLFQLDDRQLQAELGVRRATLDSAKATLAKLDRAPRPADDEGEIAAIQSMVTQGVKAIAITPTSPIVMCVRTFFVRMSAICAEK